MNVYALFPLVAVIAYIALLISTIGSRPWQRRNELFILYLTAAIIWALTDVFLRGNFFPPLNNVLLKVIIITYAWTIIQYHCFVSYFYAPGQGRWLPFAYGSLVFIVTMVLLGYLPESVHVEGDKLYLDYGKGVIFLIIPFMVLLARNVYVFWKRLKILDNPVLYNQIISLLLTLIVLTVFSFLTILPWGREYAIVHFGSIVIAFILSYATIRHQLLDIRIVLRGALAWVGLAIIGIVSYGLLIAIFHAIFKFSLDMTAMALTALAAVLIAIFVYRLRSRLFITMGKAFQRQSYDYRQRLSNFAGKIHNVFSLKEQGGELLTLVTRALGCKRAGLLFPEVGNEDFTILFSAPKGKETSLSTIRLRGQSPIVEYLRRKRGLLTQEALAILPEFRALWEQERAEVSDIELFVPLISRDKLIGILALDKKHSGRYSLEDLNLLEEVTNRVAVSMEKEYLRERLREREEELKVMNRSSIIITSSLDIKEIYDSFIEELKKVVDVNWAAIVLLEESNVHFLAVSSDVGSAWKAGERLPLKGSATEWVATHQKPVVEPDLTREARFSTGNLHLKQGIRSIVYLPLIARGRVIGSLIIGSSRPNAYNSRQVLLLEQLAAQIAMPVENSRLYAEAEKKARVDELTGLLNRRSLDEVIVSEISRLSRYGGVFSLIILDLDSFKAFNDTYGHLSGDKLLRQIGTILKSCIRSTDQAFRYGGDEFAILLLQTAIEPACEAADRVRKRIPAAVKADYLPITASLGVASWPVDGISANDIIAAADAALYVAKRSGGNQSRRASATGPVENRVASEEEMQQSETVSSIFSLAATVDAKDHYTKTHSKKVSEFAIAIGEALKLEPSQIGRLETCALLHDIGKIGINNDILNKRGKLTAQEWEIIKTHPQLGATIASHAPRIADCLSGIRHHHERFDGSGYPDGLKGEAIPLEARILAIADAFSAMSSDRSYASALPLEEVLEEIRRGAGKQFDPRLVEVFLPILRNSVIQPLRRT